MHALTGSLLQLACGIAPDALLVLVGIGIGGWSVVAADPK
jgi:hypothetical protein